MTNPTRPYLTLLFNVFLTKKARYEGVEFQNEVDKYLNPLRAKNTNYRMRSKIEICAYTLASLAEIKWDTAIINIEISNDYTTQEKNWLFNYVKTLIPNAQISTIRAKTRDEYLNIFKEIEAIDPKSYVLYIPNHDHVFMGHDPRLIHEYLEALKQEEEKTSLPIRLCYSNQLENILAIRKGSPIYNLYLLGGKILKENDQYILVERENYAWDSYYISSISVIHEYFSSSENTGYCPRGEDCFPYPFPKIKNLSLIPKIKLFEHYDGSHHVFGFKSFKNYQNKFSNRIPPLFIPPGFFESNIKIKIGKAPYDPEFINADKTRKYIYLTNNSDGVDINLGLFTIPSFWKRRISKIVCLNGGNENDLHMNALPVELENPFYDFPSSLIKERNKIFSALTKPDEYHHYYETNQYPISFLGCIKLLFKKI